MLPKNIKIEKKNVTFSNASLQSIIILPLFSNPSDLSCISNGIACNTCRQCYTSAQDSALTYLLRVWYLQLGVAWSFNHYNRLVSEVPQFPDVLIVDIGIRGGESRNHNSVGSVCAC